MFTSIFELVKAALTTFRMGCCLRKRLLETCSSGGGETCCVGGGRGGSGGAVELFEEKRASAVDMEMEAVVEVAEKISVVKEVERAIVEEETKDLESVSVEKMDENGSVVAVDAPPMEERATSSFVASYAQQPKCMVPISHGLPIEERSWSQKQIWIGEDTRQHGQYCRRQKRIRWNNSEPAGLLSPRFCAHIDHWD
uniref:AlNc14C57G4313 protein n=1 Tax=Albugo laibachii Nc14 TaxID=890382 RepID=F0WCD3_9STRA|nr:AlNc14C57G4313 [Albugo laibachii Nc14]|eukprot:CCA18848.1 AlNc14C57G4313 [Albugo laibachii Nc14]